MEPLPTARARHLEKTLTNFRRNGLELDAKGQQRLRELNEEITQLGLDFDTNLVESPQKLEVTPAQLEGLPSSFMLGHPPAKDGNVVLTTDYPDYYPRTRPAVRPSEPRSNRLRSRGGGVEQAAGDAAEVPAMSTSARERAEGTPVAAWAFSAHRTTAW